MSFPSGCSSCQVCQCVIFLYNEFVYRKDLFLLVDNIVPSYAVEPANQKYNWVGCLPRILCKPVLCSLRI